MEFAQMLKFKSDNLKQNTYLIAGLGNPGKAYRENRHNIGFMVIDNLARQLDIQLKRVKSKAIIGTGKLGDNSIILAKPQTYMNASGESISPLLRYYKVPLQNLIIIHDDLDISFGTIRIRPSGGTGGQKGMKSIVSKLGSQEIARIRIGIGRPPGRMDPADYVLHDFNSDQIALKDEILDKASQAVITFIHEGLEQAMNVHNGDLTKES